MKTTIFSTGNMLLCLLQCVLTCETHIAQWEKSRPSFVRHRAAVRSSIFETNGSNADLQEIMSLRHSPKPSTYSDTICRDTTDFFSPLMLFVICNFSEITCCRKFSHVSNISQTSSYKNNVNLRSN